MAWWEILLLIIGSIVALGGVIALLVWLGILFGIGWIARAFVRDTREDDRR